MSLQDWYASRVTAEPPPIAIALDAHFIVQDWHGLPLVMGLKLKPGIDIRDQLPFLYGLEEDQTLESVNLTKGRVVDIVLQRQKDAGFYLFLRDAKKRHDAVQEIQQQRNECAMLRKQVELASAAKSRFIAGMSHEFRTPLAAIQGYSAKIREQLGSTCEEAAAIQRASDYLLTLVENLIEQGRLDSRDTLLQKQPMELASLLGQLEEMARPLAEQRKLKFRREDAPPLPRWISIDATRVRQIAINLLGNAAKFTNQGGFGLMAAWKNGVLTLQVADTGPGIPTADQERVFAAYERNSDAPGAGLGLTISRELARRMGGDLTLQSTPGSGSRFTLQVPAPSCNAPAKAAEVAAAGRRIVLVDDDPDMRNLLRQLLEEAGHTVEALGSGDAALDYLGQHPADCLISDLKLPGMDGAALVEAVRKSSPNLHIVMLTGSASVSDRERAIEAGAHTYLVKPVTLDALMTSIDGPENSAP